jgi:toxin ParE1/3/4
MAIVWTEHAAQCLEDIYRYIYEKNQGAAHGVVSGIYEKIQLLADYPLIGHKYRLEDDGEIRTLLYGHYKIAYQVRGEETVVILGVFHGAMEIEQHLKAGKRTK